MKRIQTLIRLLAMSSLFHGINVGCSTQKGNEVPPTDTCRIQHVSAAFSGDQNSLQTDYIYDAHGQLTSRTKVSQSATVTVSSDQTTTTDSYTYDVDGFLSRSVTDVHQKAQFAGKASEYHFISTTTYAYTNERLSGLTRTDVTYNSNSSSGPQQRTVVSAFTYSYDNAGQLQQIIGHNGVSVDYQNGKQQSSPITGDIRFELQDGLMVRATFPGTDASGASQTLEQVNQYDAQRRLIKHEEYLNGQLDSYYTQEYQAGKPSEASLPAFKGHPLILATCGELGVLLRYRAYSANKQHQLVQYTEQSYENQFNAQGFVTGTKQTNQILTNGAQPPSFATMSYAYANCD